MKTKGVSIFMEFTFKLISLAEQNALVTFWGECWSGIEAGVFGEPVIQEKWWWGVLPSVIGVHWVQKGGVWRGVLLSLEGDQWCGVW